MKNNTFSFINERAKEAKNVIEIDLPIVEKIFEDLFRIVSSEDYQMRKVEFLELRKSLPEPLMQVYRLFSLIIPSAALMGETTSKFKYSSRKDAKKLDKQIHKLVTELFVGRLSINNHMHFFPISEIIYESPRARESREKTWKKIVKEYREIKDEFARLRSDILKCYNNFLKDIQNMRE